MDKKNEQAFYVSPEVEVIEFKVRETILATSNPNGSDPYERESWQ